MDQPLVVEPQGQEDQDQEDHVNCPTPPLPADKSMGEFKPCDSSGASV